MYKRLYASSTDCVVRIAASRRSDKESEFTAKRVREWLERVGVKTLSIEPGSPWENGYVESYNGKLRDELLARVVFDTLLEAKVLIERRRKAYNTVRPHSSLRYRPPSPGSGVAPPLSARFGCASASGQGRSLGRATPLMEAGSIHGGRSYRWRIVSRNDRHQPSKPSTQRAAFSAAAVTRDLEGRGGPPAVGRLGQSDLRQGRRSGVTA